MVFLFRGACGLPIGIVAAAFAAAVSAQAQTPDDDHTPSYDTCRVVATAKYDQWRQQRVLIDMVKTFSDGSIKNDEIIVDINTAYGLHRGVWRTGNLTMRARNAPSISQVLDNMGLALCARDSAVREGDQAATLYTYSYKPDSNGFVAHGKIWIADESGLPLREEMNETAPPANQMVATAISATYHYGNFAIPAGAERAESTRLFDVRQLLGGLQGGSGTPLGAGAR